MKYLVSFPRSGQTLTHEILRDLHAHYGWSYSYCEPFTCCYNGPCKKGKLFRKEHDFYLQVELSPNVPRVVLYRRDEIEQLESYFRFTTRKETWYHTNYRYDPLRRKLVHFIQHSRPYYRGFLEKWVRPENTPIDYTDYVNSPVEAVSIMLETFYPNEKIPTDVICKIIKSRKDPIEFKHRISPRERELIERDLEL